MKFFPNQIVIPTNRVLSLQSLSLGTRLNYSSDFIPLTQLILSNFIDIENSKCLKSKHLKSAFCVSGFKTQEVSEIQPKLSNFSCILTKNVSESSMFCSDIRQCLKSYLFGNRKVIECLKSDFIHISNFEYVLIVFLCYRSRDVEALKLMKHFEDFLRGETSLSPVFNDK